MLCNYLDFTQKLQGNFVNSLHHIPIKSTVIALHPGGENNWLDYSSIGLGKKQYTLFTVGHDIEVILDLVCNLLSIKHRIN